VSALGKSAAGHNRPRLGSDSRFRFRVTAVVSAGAHETLAQDERQERGAASISLLLAVCTRRAEQLLTSKGWQR
jgi:hypothetical protein